MTQKLSPEWMKINKYGVIQIKSTRAPKLIEPLGRPTTLWKTWNSIGAPILLLLGTIVSILLIILAGASVAGAPIPELSYQKQLLLFTGETTGLKPSAIPLLLVAVVLSILVHEVGHAIAATVEGQTLESVTFVFLLFLPVGAYIQTDTNGNNNYFKFARIMSAGILNNILLAFLAQVYLTTQNISFNTAYMYYLGQPLEQTTRTLTQLTLVEGFAFWLLLINLNLALLNSLPIYMLDGGQLFQRTVHKVTNVFSSNPKQTHYYLVLTSNFILTLAIATLLVAPALQF